MPSAPEPAGRVPLHAEQVEVTRQAKPTGHVTVATVTRLREELIDELLTREQAEIERVVIRQFVDEVPEIREEGDTLVIPLIEEVVVVERRLVLKEEIRIRRVRTTERHQETVTLREQDAVITRASAPETEPTIGDRGDLPSPAE